MNNMKRFIFLTLIALLFSGCASNPRYTPEKLPPKKIPISYKKGGLNKVRMGQIIESYLGAPYRENGASHNGVDCSGLVVAVYNDYNRMKLPHDNRKLFQLVKQIERDNLEFGDLVFFSDVGWVASHVGIYIGNDRFVHASKSQGVIISSLQEEYFRKGYLGARRVIP